MSRERASCPGAFCPDDIYPGERALCPGEFSPGFAFDNVFFSYFLYAVEYALRKLGYCCFILNTEHIVKQAGVEIVYSENMKPRMMT